MNLLFKRKNRRIKEKAALLVSAWNQSQYPRTWQLQAPPVFPKLNAIEPLPSAALGTLSLRNVLMCKMLPWDRCLRNCRFWRREKVCNSAWIPAQLVLLKIQNQRSLPEEAPFTLTPQSHWLSSALRWDLLLVGCVPSACCPLPEVNWLTTLSLTLLGSTFVFKEEKRS